MAKAFEFPVSNESATLRTKLTKRVVDAASFDPSAKTASGTLRAKQILWDTDLVGFGLRLQPPSKRKPRGDKLYILNYRNADGVTKYLTLGRHGEITCEQARDQARRTLASVWQGADPQTERSEQRAEARKTPVDDTFLGLANAYIEEHAKPKRKSWKTDAARLLADPDDVTAETAKNARLAAPIRRLHPLRPGHASREDVEDVLRSIHDELSSSAPVEADRLVQTVNSCLNWHVKRRNIPSTFLNTGALIDVNGSSKREDHLRPAEVAAFAGAVRTLPLEWRCAIWLMLLTGSRSKSEALSLRWEHVHFHVGELVFPVTKNGSAHRLPITPAVRILLESMPRTSEWVFPARRGNAGPIQDGRKTFAKLRKEGGFVDNITPHALRHTARTLLEAKLRVPRSTVNAILNHADDGMAATYTHISMDDVREALEELEAFVLREAKIEDFAGYLTTKRADR